MRTLLLSLLSDAVRFQFVTAVSDDRLLFDIVAAGLRRLAFATPTAWRTEQQQKKTRWERLFRRVSLHLFFFASLRGARPTSRVPFIIRHLNSDKHSVRKGDSEGWLVFSEFGQLFESVSSRYEHPSSSNTLQDKQHADRLLVKLLLQRYIPLRIGDAAVVLIPVVRA